ncbi:MAG: hypothetical protein ACREX8_00685, partial [Gammaproteobacteria bacterium]
MGTSQRPLRVGYPRGGVLLRPGGLLNGAGELLLRTGHIPGGGRTGIGERSLSVPHSASSGARPPLGRDNPVGTLDPDPTRMFGFLGQVLMAVPRILQRQRRLLSVDLQLFQRPAGHPRGASLSQSLLRLCKADYGFSFTQRGAAQ